MSDNLKLGKAALVNICVFCVGVVLAALVGKMIISDITYLPVSPDLSAVSVKDTVVHFANAASSSSVQMLLVFLSAFSVFAFPIAVSLSLFRGVSLGFTTAVAARGALAASVGITADIFDFAPILLIYFLSSAVIILFSAVASSYSASCRKGREGLLMTKKFFFSFLMFSGVLFTSDALKLLFL